MDYAPEIEHLIATCGNAEALGEALYDKTIRYATGRLADFLKCELRVKQESPIVTVAEFVATLTSGLNIKLGGIICGAAPENPPGINILTTLFLYVDGVRVEQPDRKNACVSLQYFPDAQRGGQWCNAQWHIDEWDEYRKYSTLAD